jgi:hypothetical protein
MEIIADIKSFIARNFFYKYTLKKTHSSMNPPLTEMEWHEQGCPLPPPYTLKRRVMLDYKSLFKTKVFIETGTFMGDTTWAMSEYFDKLYTIEIDNKLFSMAVERFKDISKIKVVNGDGGTTLPIVLSNIQSDEVCLFWLDGHYSGSITGKGDSNTPILKEIESVYNHNINHIILVDDARLFVGKDDYPTLEYLKSFAMKLNSSLKFEVKEDIIRLTPNY